MPDAEPIARRHAAMLVIAADAGARALAHFRARDALIVEEKASPQDVVSRADREVETLIRDRVAAAFPGDGFLGEEFGREAGTSGFTWVIDPIDGTVPFLAGQPTWCVALALLRDAETLAAAALAPVTGELFEARRGGGMRAAGRPVRLDPRPGLAQGVVAVGANHRSDPAAVARVVERLLAAGGMFYRNGSGALMLAYVAAGRLAGYWEDHMHPWDSIGGLLMVEEAGGRTAPYPEAGLEAGGRVLAAAPGAWDALAALVDGP